MSLFCLIFLIEPWNLILLCWNWCPLQIVLMSEKSTINHAHLYVTSFSIALHTRECRVLICWCIYFPMTRSAIVRVIRLRQKGNFACFSIQSFNNFASCLLRSLSFMASHVFCLLQNLRPQPTKTPSNSCGRLEGVSSQWIRICLAVRFDL